LARRHRAGTGAQATRCAQPFPVELLALCGKNFGLASVDCSRGGYRSPTRYGYAAHAGYGALGIGQCSGRSSHRSPQSLYRQHSLNMVGVGKSGIWNVSRCRRQPCLCLCLCLCLGVGIRYRYRYRHRPRPLPPPYSAPAQERLSARPHHGRTGTGSGAGTTTTTTAGSAARHRHASSAPAPPPRRHRAPAANGSGVIPSTRSWPSLYLNLGALKWLSLWPSALASIQPPSERYRGSHVNTSLSPPVKNGPS
jgi:hypothetical protein